MRSTMQIAVDGPAGSGKSTIAKKLAEKLDMLYIDTGAMYRALTYKVISMGIDIRDDYAVIQAAKSSQILLKKGKVCIDGEDVGKQIRSSEVDASVSRIAEIPQVREIMVQKQRKMALSQNVVMDGRDIGTNVLPDARYKFFLTASIEERAMRRYRDKKTCGSDEDYETVKKEILRRDEIDSTREIAPLKKAKDAVIIDTTGKTIDEVLEQILIKLGVGADVL